MWLGVLMMDGFVGGWMEAGREEGGKIEGRIRVEKEAGRVTRRRDE